MRYVMCERPLCPSEVPWLPDSNAMWPTAASPLKNIVGAFFVVISTWNNIFIKKVSHNLI
jgi:hypothetical protein